MAGRAYHGFSHVERLIARQLAVAGDCPAPVALFVFFHDAVYDSTRADNELRSAALFLDELGDHCVGLGPEAELGLMPDAERW